MRWPSLATFLLLGAATAHPGRAGPISTDGTCGGQRGYTCLGSSFGNCCSRNGYCGDSDAYCTEGCIASFGICKDPPVQPPSHGTKPSQDGSCGGTNGYTCLGSTFGNCCSRNGYCGSSDVYCTEGCNAAFGMCKDPPATPSKPSSKVSKDGSCGGANGYTCLGSTFGNCCSRNGYCGSTDVYCTEGCNTAFGICKDPPVQPPSPGIKPSQDGSCGGANRYTCLGSTFGNCCSKNGYCGSSDAYCTEGCNAAFGMCKDPPATPSNPDSKVSKDGSCGGTNRYTCLGSTFGNCCSRNGYCGSSDAYCTEGCNAAFGMCKDPPAVPPKPSSKVSKDGSCGGANGYTCLGSTFGSCCSKNGYCGSSDVYCTEGCNTAFGICKDPPAVPSNPGSKVSRDGTCGGASGFTCMGSTFGICCSKNGYCGSSDAYCTEGCNAAFGMCKDPPAPTPSRPTTTPVPGTDGKVTSPNGSCGEGTGYTCIGSSFGNCCGRDGKCGYGDFSCGDGCKVSFGACNRPPPSPSSTTVRPTITVTPVPGTDGKVTSTNGSCGGSTGFTCIGSSFGNCCGRDGRCGFTDAACGTGCNVSFGACNAPPPGTPGAPTAVKPSTNGMCGQAAGMTCAGSRFGACCSRANTCGYSCTRAQGCQSSYGTCY